MEINQGKFLADRNSTRRLDIGWSRWGGHKVEHEPGSGRFCGREHRLPLRIYCEDTDFSGVVYHANYVRYLERGRSDFIRELGVGLSSLLHAERPVTFMVSRLDLRFMRPARIDDRLEVSTLVEVASGARVVCKQSILRGNETLIEAISENVCVGLDGRPRRLPAMFMQKIAPFLPEAVRAAAESAIKNVVVRELEAVA